MLGIAIIRGRTQIGKFSQFEKYVFLALPLAVAIARVFTRQRRTEQEADKAREQSRGGEQRRRAEQRNTTEEKSRPEKEKRKGTEEENRGAEQSGRGEQTRRGEQRSRAEEENRGEAEQTRRAEAENRTEEKQRKDRKRRHAHTDFNFWAFFCVRNFVLKIVFRPIASCDIQKIQFFSFPDVCAWNRHYEG